MKSYRVGWRVVIDSCPQRDSRAAELSALLASAKGVSASPSTTDVAKYVKLVQLGQPIDHVKARMKADGVDPDLLKM